MYYIVRMSKKVELKKTMQKYAFSLRKEKKVRYFVHDIIRGGYVPNKIRTVNTQTNMLSLN